MCPAQCQKMRKGAINCFVVSLDSELAQVGDESVRLLRSDTTLALRHREDVNGSLPRKRRQCCCPAGWPIGSLRTTSIRLVHLLRCQRSTQSSPPEISNPAARLLSKPPLSGGPNRWIDRFWFPARLSRLRSTPRFR